MEEAGIEPEEEIDDDEAAAENKEKNVNETTPEEKRNIKDKRLSVFEDYLKKRNIGKSDRGDNPPTGKPAG